MGANFCLIVSYEEIGESCESKKCKTPNSARTRVRAREGILSIVDLSSV